MTMVSAQSDEPQFRNGRPVRMAGWMHIKHGRLARRQARYIRLNGEVFSTHASENDEAEEEFDVVGASIEFSERESRRSLRIITSRRTMTCYFASAEEMQSWAQSLDFASNHSFERYYNLGSSIAEGTFSRIFYAYDREHPDNLFAVKVVRKRAHDPQALEWLRRERHLNSVLNHPTIVQAVDMFSTLEKDFLVFELMRGGTLADMLKGRRKLPESYARTVMRELFTALHYIHGKNIVHRDIRPENIFCSATKFPMSICLGDFGLANFLSEKRVNPDVLTSMLGMPPYISVDIVRRVKYGPSADMWSAGVVLYQLLSGELPFIGRNDREVVEKIKLGEFTMSSPSWDSVSAEAKGLVRQLLQTDQFKRISALASLQHRWFAGGPNGLSRPASTASMATSPPVSSGIMFGDRDSPGSTSVEGRRSVGGAMPTSVSNFSRVPSSTSSASQSRDISDKGDWSERQTSSIGLQPSLRSMHHVSSMSSLSQAPQTQPRLKMTPSVRAIAELGLQRVASDNPARMKRLLSSRLVQKQLSVTLPYRRKLVVAARSFVFVFRLKSLVGGHNATRQLSQIGRTDVDRVNDIIDRRTRALKEGRNSRDRTTAESLHSATAGGSGGSKRGHVRQRSREVAAHLLGKLNG